MNNQQKIIWVVVAVLVVLFIAAIVFPNLLRSRKAANQAMLISRLRNGQTKAEKSEGKLSLYQQPASPEKKLIRNAELGLSVRNVRTAAEQIRNLTEASRGEIDKLEIKDDSDGLRSATLVLRVPAAGLEDALSAFKQVAIRTEREQISARDVTREFYDAEAHLRNLNVEEQQYRAIMKQAHTVHDTVEVSGKLSDVRDRIERLETQIRIMTRDIEMSEVSILLVQEEEARVLGLHWRPLHSAKVAAHELFGGLGEWFDWLVAVVIKLPLILLWIATVGVILLTTWKIGKWGWLRWFKSQPPEHL